MSPHPPGKIPPFVLESAVLKHTGSPRSEVLVGPRHGVDAGMVDLGGGRVMIVTTDPLFIMPELGWQRACWFAVHIIASDAATSGLAPQYMTVDLNLPIEADDDTIAAIAEGLHAACTDLEVAIVTGHTGRYDGCAFPTVGGGTMIATGPATHYVNPSSARPGDRIILTKGAAIETTALFAACAPTRVRESCGEDVLREAERMFFEMSTVRDALTAVQAGVGDTGVCAMHDATERGIIGALSELSYATGCGMVVDRDAIPLSRAARAICSAFAVDPYATSSEGSLLILARSAVCGEVLARLADTETVAVEIGELTDQVGEVRISIGGREQALAVPDTDPFWPALRAAVSG